MSVPKGRVARERKGPKRENTGRGGCLDCDVTVCIQRMSLFGEFYSAIYRRATEKKNVLTPSKFMIGKSRRVMSGI